MYTFMDEGLWVRISSVLALQIVSNCCQFKIEKKSNVDRNTQTIYMHA